MSKVYILWARTNYEPSTIVGIFASEISANERLEQIERQLLSRPEWPGNGTESEEDDAWERLEKWREDNPDAFCCEFSDTRQIEEFDLQGSHLPQDVEEFIASNKMTWWTGTSQGTPTKHEAIPIGALLDWMTGHVRVPVETLLEIQAGFHRASVEVLEWGGYASGYFQKKHRLQETATNFTLMAESINELLNASKGDS